MRSLTTAAAFLFLLANVDSHAADGKKAIEPLVNAKTVFVYDRTDACKECVDDVKQAITAWQRYKVTDDVKQADLVFTLTFDVKTQARASAYAAQNQGNQPNSGGQPAMARDFVSYSLRLTVFDYKTHKELYRDVEPKVFQWSHPGTDLVKDYRKRLEKAERK
jgi:hypothetical protein